jgi:hypothetical protein
MPTLPKLFGIFNGRPLPLEWELQVKLNNVRLEGPGSFS